MRALGLLIAALGVLLTAGVGYELGHVRGYRAGVDFEARWNVCGRP